ncbi:MAG: helix-turn-helix transcriptional regulator [Firmicutes bacterium]|nr:helix-turn-helix transcriptional regulator [Bacillota bacterium]MBV1726899.1 helix-turn-helix transcriptional regulator [Desulforudis sp.]MBU4533323.1 helix-turn-helix transcriptional regulator [Bacillota bacterium]MBU4554273.1 helix-turn-helix transcriptional regulator [Bacillota bacterium]MBV1736327.1 helix-turn-helix transcriptional regulator [Desulforudis sp.]
MVHWTLHIIMGERRLKIAEVAREAGLAWETVSKIYKGQAEFVSLKTIDALCKALDCQPGDLLKRKEGV